MSNNEAPDARSSADAKTEKILAEFDAREREREEEERRWRESRVARHGRTMPIAVRFDASTLERLRALAARRNKGYQTLLKEFVVERLYEEEKREGIIPS
jgi:hypothetical protein